MLISIIIPTRNRYAYINLLIGDILQQDVSNYEIIVVDQSNTPKEIPNCKHIITDTLGPCVSRNIGTKEAKGEILVFLDDDARIYPDFIREISSPIIKGRFDAVAGAMCDPHGNYPLIVDDFLKGKNENFIKILTNNPDAPESRISISFPGCCAAILKSVFDEVGGFDESFDPTGAGEDREMAVKLYKNGYSTWYNAKAKLLHAVAPTGGTRDVGSRTFMIDIHSFRICQKYFSQELTKELRYTILRKYKYNFFSSLSKFKRIRTKYKLYREAKKQLN